MGQVKKNKRWDFLNGIVIVLMLICVCVGCSVVIKQYPSYQIPNYAENYLSLNTATLWEEQGERVCKLPESIMRYDAGENIYVSVVLPEELYHVECPVLLLSADHCNVEVFLDETLIYERNMGENGISGTEGFVLLFVDLPQDWQGKELTIHYTTLLDRIAFYYTKELYVGCKSDIVLHKLKSDIPILIIDALLYFSGIILLIVHVVGKMWKRYNNNFCMVGVFAVLSASYLIIGTDWLRLVIRYQYVLYILQYIFLMLLTLPLMLLIEYNVKQIRLKRMLAVCISVEGANFLFMYMLNFLFGVDFKFLVILTHIILLVCAFMALGILIQAYRKRVLMEGEDLFTLIVPSVACIMDLVFYYLGLRDLGMMIMRIGVLIYVMLQFYYNSKRIVNLMQQRYKMKVYRDMAYHDSMTGLRNRAAYETDLRKYTEECENGNHKFCVFSVDVNNLKKTNDEQGHMAGDTLIIHIASVLWDGVREWGDVYRIGGDEFVIFVKNHTMEEADLIKENIHQALIRFNAKNKTQISFSLGMAYFDKEQDANLEATLARADVAMYEDKQRGKAAGIIQSR